MTSARGPKRSTMPSRSTSILSTPRSSEGRCANDHDGDAVLLQRLAAQRMQRLLAVAVEVRRSARRAPPAAGRRRARARARCAGAGRARAPARLRRSRCRSPAGRRRISSCTCARCAARITSAAVGLAEAGDVLGHRAAEQLHVLRQVADVRAEALARPGGDVGAVQAHHARGRAPDADQQARQGGLARRARADQAERLAGLELERDAAQHRLVARGAKTDALHARARPCGGGSSVCGSAFGVGFEQLVQPPPGAARLDQAAPARDQRLDRRERAAEQDGGGDHHARR